MKNEILYGIHPVLEALKASRRAFFEIRVAKKKSNRIVQITSIAESRGIPVRSVESADLKSSVGSVSHQGTAAWVSAYPFVPFGHLLDKFKSKDDPPLLLLLDNVMDPQNLGAMIRTGMCAGIDGIIIPKDRAASPTPSVSKASAGALEHIRLSRVTNLVQTVKTLKNQGFWIIGLEKNEQKSIFDSDLTGPLALVIGGEQKGIRPLVKKNCDLLLSIPQRSGPVDSLNAAAAGAIVIYEAYRQRHGSQKNDE